MIKTAHNNAILENIEQHEFKFMSTHLGCAAQDRSPFCISHIMNKFLQNPELTDIFLVGNHCHIFRKIIK